MTDLPRGSVRVWSTGTEVVLRVEKLGGSDDGEALVCLHLTCDEALSIGDDLIDSAYTLIGN